MSAAKRHRELALGLLGLVLLAGLAWALRDPGGLGVPGAGERFVVPHAPARDLTRGAARLPAGGGELTVAVDVAPRPLRALADHVFRVRVERADGAAAADVEAVELAFNMEMDMGRHVYDARAEGDAWRADVVVPTCAWGGERWYLRVRVRSADGAPREAIFLFDVPLTGGPAAAAPAPAAPTPAAPTTEAP